MNEPMHGPKGFIVWLLISALAGGVVALSLAAWLLGSWPAARIALLGIATPTVRLAPNIAESTTTPTATDSPTSAAAPTLTATPTATPSPVPIVEHPPTATATASLEELLAASARGVVTVVNAPEIGPNGLAVEGDTIWGSGVIVDARGYVLTNQHVVRRVGRLVVLVPDKGEVQASYIGGDDAADLALLRLNAPGAFPTVRWGESSRLRLGQTIAVIGTPLGNLPGSVTMGVISGLNRSVSLDDDTQFTGLIQTDAAINHGNSGGGLLDARGELVGLVTLMLRDGTVLGRTDVQGISFALPASAARPLVDEWIAVDNP